MTLEKSTASRRDFLKASVGVGGALGILASPIGMTQAIDSVSADVAELPRPIPGCGSPAYPIWPTASPSTSNTHCRSTTISWSIWELPLFWGVGPDSDIVVFSYSCAHMGCPLNGMYKSEHNVLGPCTCHFSQFDLTKSGILSIGQATQSLPQVLLEVEGSGIFATGVTGLLYGH